MSGALLYGRCLLVLTGLSLLATSAAAHPEGTRDLVPALGLLKPHRIIVRADVGETIRLCSSDDGRTEEPARIDLDGDGRIGPDESFALDVEPARALHCGLDGGACPPGRAPFPTHRIGRELLVFPPSLRPCVTDDGCLGGRVCLTARGVEPEPGRSGVCVHALAVDAERGWCDANQVADDRRWHAIEVDQAGDWTVDLVGEPDTLIPGERSTRFFEVDVVDTASQESRPAGRVGADYWNLTTHAPGRGASPTFYVGVPGTAARSHVIAWSLVDLRGALFALAVGRDGLRHSPRQSSCVYGDSGGTCASMASGDAPYNALEPDLVMWLNPPELGPAPDQPTLSDVRFDNGLGTAMLSPDGDGVADKGTFSFVASAAGRFELAIDVDGDGDFDARDHHLIGEAAPGANSVAWDGRGASGLPLPTALYAFRLRVLVDETHLHVQDAENNEVGFVAYRLHPGRIEHLAMYWDDGPVAEDRVLVQGADDVLSSLPSGSATSADAGPQRRYWRQRARRVDGELVDSPLNMDTWIYGDHAEVTRAVCAQCDGPVDRIEVRRAEPEPRDPVVRVVDAGCAADLGCGPHSPDYGTLFEQAAAGQPQCTAGPGQGGAWGGGPVGLIGLLALLAGLGRSRERGRSIAVRDGVPRPDPAPGGPAARGRGRSPG